MRKTSSKQYFVSTTEITPAINGRYGLYAKRNGYNYSEYELLKAGFELRTLTDEEMSAIATEQKAALEQARANYRAIELERRAKQVELCLAGEPITIGEAHVVMEVERMLYEPVANWTRLKPLLKKAMKAYLYGEIAEVKGDGRAIDLQISAVSDLLRTMESQRAQMVDRNGETATDNYINATRGAIESLKVLKHIYDNGSKS